MKVIYLSVPIGVQIKSDSGILRGVLFCVKGKCAVFYSVLRANARCFILCDTLWNWTPIGTEEFISLEF